MASPIAKKANRAVGARWWGHHIQLGIAVALAAGHGDGHEFPDHCCS